MSDAYAFRAVDSVGVKIKGEIEADSKEAVNELLKGRGLLALEVKLKTKSAELSFDRFTPVSLEDLALLTRQLSTMISSGLSLMRALMVLEAQTTSKRLRAVVVAIRQDVESGTSLSTALSRHPKIFSELFVAMIRAGETGGFLESTLMRVADQLEAQHKLRRQVKAAMVYPAVVSSIAVCVVAAMLLFIIPVFAGVFKEFGGKMPSLTTHTIAVSNLLRYHWYILVFGIPALVLGFRKWKTPGPDGRSGPLPPQGAGQDRHHRAEDRPGPLGPHAVLADLRRRPHARGHRRHRAETAGNTVDREGDGRRCSKSVQGGRHDRRRSWPDEIRSSLRW